MRPGRWPVVRLVLCLGLAGTALAAAAEDDFLAPSPPLPSSALVLTRSNQGSGFLIDQGERLLITNHHVTGAKGDVQVIFPVIEDGRARAKRDYYLTKAPRLRGKVLYSDAKLDLAAVRLDSVPSAVPELRLASASPKKGDRAHFIGNPGNSAQAWVYDAGTVQRVAQESYLIGKQEAITARSIEVKADGLQAGGSSGCPVVNSASELIGVLSAGAEGGRLLVCIDITEVRCFLGAVHRQQGTEALQSGDYTRAVGHCDKALRINPDDPLTYNERGAACSYLDRHDEAIADYTSALKLAPKLVRAYRNRASVYFYKGNYDAAVADSSKAIALDPKYASAYQVRAKAYQKLGKGDEARLDTEKAVLLAKKAE